jgi:hypothetical protein
VTGHGLVDGRWFRQRGVPEFVWSVPGVLQVYEAGDGEELPILDRVPGR